MLHAPAASAQPGIHFYLLHKFALLPLTGKKTGEAREWPGNAGDGQSTISYDSFWKGVAASLGHEWHKAEREFSAAITSCVGLPEASYGRGVARYHQGDIQGSLKDLGEATRQSPTYALAFLWAGRAWERQGNTLNARAAYQQAADLAPPLSEAWFHLGALAYKEGDLLAAQEYLEKAHDDFDQAAKRWWYLGHIAWSRGQHEKAWSAFQRALELDPKLAPAYLDGGKVLLELGRPREASHILGKLVQLEPQRATARYHLALAYQLSWNTAAAWEQYFTLQQLNPQMAAHLASRLEGGQ
jgi:tetratricopeptide (TPR) repeat protein